LRSTRVPMASSRASTMTSYVVTGSGDQGLPNAFPLVPNAFSLWLGRVE
jgi:hypothetical protein